MYDVYIYIYYVTRMMYTSIYIILNVSCKPAYSVGVRVARWRIF